MARRLAQVARLGRLAWWTLSLPSLLSLGRLGREVAYISDLVEAVATCPLLCRFLDAGMTNPSTRSCGRRPKSAKARNRGTYAGAVPPDVDHDNGTEARESPPLAGFSGGPVAGATNAGMAGGAGGIEPPSGGINSAVHPNSLREPDLDQRPQGDEPDDRRTCKSKFRQAVSKQKSNHLARNRLAFLSKPSIAVRTGSHLKRAFGPSPAGSFTWVGLRWCGE
jgi:hypothetical protein